MKWIVPVPRWDALKKSKSKQKVERKKSKEKSQKKKVKRKESKEKSQKKRVIEKVKRQLLVHYAYKIIL